MCLSAPQEIVARALEESGRSSSSTLTLADFCQVSATLCPLSLELRQCHLCPSLTCTRPLPLVPLSHLYQASASLCPLSLVPGQCRPLSLVLCQCGEAPCLCQAVFSIVVPPCQLGGGGVASFPTVLSAHHWETQGSGRAHGSCAVLTLGAPAGFCGCRSLGRGQ